MKQAIRLLLIVCPLPLAGQLALSSTRTPLAITSQTANRPTTQRRTALKSRARQLAARFESLDTRELHELLELKSFAFEPLCKRYVSLQQRATALYRSDSTSELDVAKASRLNDICTRMEPYLLQIASTSDAASMTRALFQLDKAKCDITFPLKLVQEKCSPNIYIPALIKRVRSKLPTSSLGDPSWQYINILAESRHPQAIRFMLDALKNPSAPAAWRGPAFRNLARTAGARGRALILAVRWAPAAKTAWFDKVDISHLPGGQLLKIATDRHDRRWTLFHSDILGNQSNLFVAPQTNKSWGRPMFTGIWSDKTWRMSATKSYRGIPVGAIETREWIHLFPDDVTIRRDTDGDGLTDLVEQRLGTNPQKKDTDGDGNGDAIDPCPNAAPRKLSDTEKVLAACIEARFYASDYTAPAILSIRQVKPFQVRGYPGTLIWDIGEGHHKRLKNCFDGGVNFITLASPHGSRPSCGSVMYNRTRTRAGVAISRISGGLNAETVEVQLAKFGSEWFMMSMETTMVS